MAKLVKQIVAALLVQKPIWNKQALNQPRLAQRRSTPPPLPDQQTFRQYLRKLARGAIGVVLEEVMREELDALIGVGWGECNPKRKGYRNGFYCRDLITSSGRLEDLQVPRDREGHFHTQVFDRYSRYEPHIAEGRDGDVRGRHEHPQGQRSRSNAAGSCSKSAARSVV